MADEDPGSENAASRAVHGAEHAAHGPPVGDAARSAPPHASRALRTPLPALRTPLPSMASGRSSLDNSVFSRAPKLAHGWSFIPMAPLIVLVVGLAVAISIGVVGLDHLARAGEDHAGTRAQLLATTLAARMHGLPDDARREVIELAARRSGAELLVATPDGRVLVDETLGAPPKDVLVRMLQERRGALEMRLGRSRFAVEPIDLGASPPALVVFVAEPAAAQGAPMLVSSLVALVTLLLGTAAIVAFAVSRDVTRDVDFFTRRVHGMTHVRTEPTGELIPARTMDQVGLLTVAFNDLVGRFEAAEAAYRHDLSRVQAADRERAAFLAAVSHELRSPLNAILGFADVLMDEVDGPLSPSAREEVEQIRGSGQHLLGLINDLLEFSALESGQLRLSKRPRDLVELANEVVREARGLVGGKPLALRLEFTEPVVAQVDGRRIRQVLGNLVNNAIKFTPHGEVTLRVTKERRHAVITVADTGPGISEHELPFVFHEYKQGKSERRRRRGTGLGLAIARRIVLLHHGSLSVESAVGRGAAFRVVLPIGDVDVGDATRQGLSSARPDR